MTVNFGLLGGGRIGKVHAQNVAANAKARLVAIADALPAAAETLASVHRCEVRSIEEIETADDIDAVVIATPTDTHAELIERFARAGKAVFCEKPIHLDIKRVQKCLDVVSATGATLMVGFNRRFDPHFLATRDAIAAGAVGNVEQVQITSRDPAPPPHEYISRSGGVFRDMTIHDFDMARFMLEEEPVSVMAVASVLIDQEIASLDHHDSVSVILLTASGRQCLISNSRRATYGYDQRVEVSKGMIAAENHRPISIETASAEGFLRPALHDFFMTRYTEAYRAEIDAFIASVESGSPASPSGRDGLMALPIAEAAVRSAREGRLVAIKEFAHA